MDTLVLQVPLFESATRWDWRLTFPTGKYLKDHSVTLDEALAAGDLHDLPAYLRRHGLSPDGAAEAVARAGDWISRHLLGELGPVIAKQAPATVEVRLPAQASALMRWPLELGYAPDPFSAGELLPLAYQDVSFVYEILGEEAAGGRWRSCWATPSSAYCATPPGREPSRSPPGSAAATSWAGTPAWCGATPTTRPSPTTSRTPPPHRPARRPRGGRGAAAWTAARPTAPRSAAPRPHVAGRTSATHLAADQQTSTPQIRHSMNRSM